MAPCIACSSSLGTVLSSGPVAGTVLSSGPVAWVAEAEGLDSPPPSSCTVLQRAEGRLQRCAVLYPEPGQRAALQLTGVAVHVHAVAYQDY